MAIDPKRFSLWAGSGGYSAMDDLVRYLEQAIDETLSECEEDPAALAYHAAGLHALATLGEGTSGYAASFRDVSLWELRTMAVYGRILDENPAAAEEVDDQRAFLLSLFERLKALRPKD